MTIKDTLVTVERTEATPARTALAAVLAERFKAHLIGVAAAPPSADALAPIGYDAGIGPVSFDSDELVARRKARAQRAAAEVDAARVVFEQVAAKHGSAEWRLAADWSGSPWRDVSGATCAGIGASLLDAGQAGRCRCARASSTQDPARSPWPGLLKARRSADWGAAGRRRVWLRRRRRTAARGSPDR